MFCFVRFSLGLSELCVTKHKHKSFFSCGRRAGRHASKHGSKQKHDIAAGSCPASWWEFLSTVGQSRTRYNLGPHVRPWHLYSSDSYVNQMCENTFSDHHLLTWNPRCLFNLPFRGLLQTLSSPFTRHVVEYRTKLRLLWKVVASNTRNFALNARLRGGWRPPADRVKVLLVTCSMLCETVKGTACGVTSRLLLIIS